ncbi:hypothetical protein [Hoeflea alexandrii]|uniref:hypothetical protein n=1 Tax=Hoeflea alexandrii TaxID=288436 RepID=UPI0022B03B8D|nr:hypothetical protein [Hoeflea alexandrii]MCZ4291165.1 hypothetical protein [Hoeflea alexandrii]
MDRIIRVRREKQQVRYSALCEDSDDAGAEMTSKPYEDGQLDQAQAIPAKDDRFWSYTPVID